MMSERTKQAVFILASFLTVTVGYYGWKLIFMHTEWRSAASEIRESYKKGDVVAIFPSWMREDVAAFEGMAAVSPREDSYVNMHGFSRLWTAVNTKHAPDRLQIKNVMREVKSSNTKNVAIRLYDLPPYNATGEFPKASVYRIEGDKREPCEKRPDGTFKCGTEGWQYVGPLKGDVGGAQSECIWAHPMRDRKIEIELPPPPAGTSKFNVYTAFLDSGAGGGHVPAVKFELLQNGRQIKAYDHPQRQGWIISQTPFSSDASKPVIVRISTAEEGRQHWCFNVEAE